MKRSVSIFFLILLGFVAAASQWTGITSDTPVPAKIQLISSVPELSVVKFTLEGYSLNPVQTPQGTAFTVSAGKATPIELRGAPDLPKLTAALAIPDLAGMQVNVLSSEYKEFQNVVIAPSKGVISRDTDPSTVPFTYGREYSSNSFFPGKLASSADPYIIRDVRGQNVQVYPFQYNPVTKVLRVYSSITVELKKVNDLGSNPLTRKVLNGRESQEFGSLLQHHFLNGDNILYTPLEDYGKVLVICHGPFMSAMEPWVDWKNSMGYPTKIVDVATIGTTSSAIKTYISNYYTANGLSFVLLVGDKPQIPTNSGSGLGGPSDNAYGYLVGSDHYQDVFIGRFSAENVAQVQTQVQRTLEYEKTPGLLTDDWYTTVIGIASDQGPGDDNEMDYQHIRNQQSQLLAYTYTMHPELFDGSQGGLDATGNPTPAMVATEVNNGSSLILYTGHGSTTSWGTSGFSNNNVNQLTNAGKLPFIWSVACVNGEFMNTTCFAEAWMRASQNGQPTGAIGFLGSTINQSWNSPMAGQDEMTDILAESYPTNIKRTFAGLSINGCMKMIDEYGTDGSNMADTWTVFGDPTLIVRTDNPAALTATHDMTLFTGSTSVTVNCPVNGARAAVSLNDSLMATGLIANNTVTLTFPALSTPGDSVRIVVTAYNYTPYISDIPIITATGPYILYNNNHLNDTTGNNNHQVEFGENPFITLYLKNIGIAATTNLNVILRTGDEFAVLTDSVASYGAMAPGEVKSVIDGFAFSVPVNIPDGHVISFDVISTDDTTVWNSSFSLVAHAPALATSTVSVRDSLGNNNGRLDPGETAFIKVYITNNGSAGAENVLAALVSASPYVTITSPALAYGNLNPGNSNSRLYQAEVDASAPEGVMASFMHQITADPGITAYGTFELIIGKIPVLVIDYDGNTNSGTVMQTAVQGLGLTTKYMNSLPLNLSDYRAVFVCLGTYPDNSTLSNGAGQQLSTFLNNGGRVYMEGGDTWKYDPQTPVHPMFHINGDEDGSSDLGTITGYTGTFTEGMSFEFSGDNSYIDRLSPQTGAFAILKNTSPDYMTTIAYDEGTYRTIGSSSEFGGLTDGSDPSTKSQLMQEYLNFFGIQPAPLMASFLGYPTSILPGETVGFLDFSTGGATSWSWSFPGGTPSTSADQNPVVTYENSGIFDVQLIVSNGTDTDTLLREDYITSDWPTGTPETDKFSCLVWPNPSNGILSLKATTGTDSDVTIEVFSMVGRKVWTGSATSTGGRISSQIDLTTLPAGMYFLTIRSATGAVTEKVVIR